MKYLKYTLVALMIALSCSLANAACQGSSPTWTTDGNEAADVQECINGATAGDTINVIAGDGVADWNADSVTIPANKPVKLIGPGRDALTINLTSTSGYAIVVGNVTANPSVEITGFRFYSSVLDRRSGAIQIGGQNWRIHHNTFDSNMTPGAIPLYGGMFVNAIGLPLGTTPLSGLIDNNIIINGRIYAGGFYSFAVEGDIWYAETGLGESGNIIYMENNNFSSTMTVDYLRAQVLDSSGSGKFVFRYNTLQNVFIMNHSLQSSTNRGGRSWEVYGNTFSTAYRVTGGPVGLKSGTGVAFNNTFNKSSSYAYPSTIGFSNLRSNTDIGGTAGKCDGDSQYDGNELANGYPCRDQIGRGKDASDWSSVLSLPAPAQALEPAYTWSLFIDGTLTAPSIAAEDAHHIQANRDLYAHVTDFTGASGVGCGTLAARPACASGCQVGVGYWATNQSCTDMTGLVGENPATPISGTLYKLTAAGEWTEYYTPYDYPHPLNTDAATPDSTPPTVSSAVISSNGLVLSITFVEPVDANVTAGIFTLTASGGAATLTYTSGTGTATLVYGISRAIKQAETVTLAGDTDANDIEDAANNDLADFTGFTVANDSTVQDELTTYTLTVTKGTGVQVVTGSGGISCGSTCVSTLASGFAASVSGSCMNGWKDPSYTDDVDANGNVTMNANKATTVSCSQERVLN